MIMEKLVSKTGPTFNETLVKLVDKLFVSKDVKNVSSAHPPNAAQADRGYGDFASGVASLWAVAAAVGQMESEKNEK